MTSCGGSNEDTSWGRGGSAARDGGTSGGAADGGGVAGNAGNAAGNAGNAGNSTAGNAGSQAGNAGSPAGGGGGPAGSGGGVAGSGGGVAGSGGGVPPVGCYGMPLACEDIGPDQATQLYGCCYGETVYWCDDEGGTWGLHDYACAQFGQTCGYSTDYDSMYCLDPGCTADSCPQGEVCENGKCVKAPCTANSCPSGQACINKECWADPGASPGKGPGPVCSNLPPITCTGTDAYCSELVPFDPDNQPDFEGNFVAGSTYVDYPVNGESWGNQYRSFIRRDLMMLIKYATAFVACKTWDDPQTDLVNEQWSTGVAAPLGLDDMSKSDGSTPEAVYGEPGHPQGTHVGGFDIDLAYYQKGTQDNATRAVCAHTNNGQDIYHCTAAPTSLDVWRTALFIGALHDHPSLRVVGVDGQIGLKVEPAIARLCEDGWLSNAACTAVTRVLMYEVTNDGYGWYLFHDEVMQVSF